MKWGVAAQSLRARDSCKKILDHAETYVSYFVFLVTNIKNDYVLIKVLTEALFVHFVCKVCRKEKVKNKPYVNRGSVISTDRNLPEQILRLITTLFLFLE